MKIYKLEINEVGETPDVCVSSFSPRRTRMKVEYYMTEEKAKQRQSDVYEGLQKLVGFFPKVEAVIIPIEVIE